MNIRVCTAFFLSMTITFMAMPTVLLGQAKASKVDALTKEADVIVVGKVGQRVSEWSANHTRIESRVTVSIDQTIKGTAPGNSITVVTPGGEVDGVGEWYSHTPKLEQEENVVLFVKKENNGRYRIAGGEGGKFLIKKDVRTGARMIPNVGTLDEFTTAIKKSVQATDNGTIGH